MVSFVASILPFAIQRRNSVLRLVSVRAGLVRFSPALSACGLLRRNRARPREAGASRVHAPPR